MATLVVCLLTFGPCDSYHIGHIARPLSFPLHSGSLFPIQGNVFPSLTVRPNLTDFIKFLVFPGSDFFLPDIFLGLFSVV